MTIPAPTTVPTRESVMAAILTHGDRTELQVADRLGVAIPDRESEQWVVRPFHLWTVLNSLHCAGFLSMRVVDREWHYLPTAKARREQ